MTYTAVEVSREKGATTMTALPVSGERVMANSMSDVISPALSGTAAPYLSNEDRSRGLAVRERPRGGERREERVGHVFDPPNRDTSQIEHCLPG